MSDVLEMCDRFIKLSLSNLMQDIFSRFDVRWFVIELNTKEQLYEKGIDSKGKSLGDYAPFTIDRKIDSGLPYDRITLFETGEFYESFEVKVYKEDIEIVANPDKFDTKTGKKSNLYEDFGIDIVGLTDENTVKLQEYLLPLIQAEIMKLI